MTPEIRLKHPFSFNVKSAVQATGVILREESIHRMNYIKLLNLLYMAERELLLNHGHMITGDIFVATHRGPVLDSCMELIYGEHSYSHIWYKYIEKNRSYLFLKKNPRNGNMSQFTTRLLQNLVQKYQDFDEYDIYNVVCKFPEFVFPDKPRPNSWDKRLNSHDCSNRFYAKDLLTANINEQNKIDHILEEAIYHYKAGEMLKKQKGNQNG